MWEGVHTATYKVLNPHFHSTILSGEYLGAVVGDLSCRVDAAPYALGMRWRIHVGAWWTQVGESSREGGGRLVSIWFGGTRTVGRLKYGKCLAVGLLIRVSDKEDSFCMGSKAKDWGIGGVGELIGYRLRLALHMVA